MRKIIFKYSVLVILLLVVSGIYKFVFLKDIKEIDNKVVDKDMVGKTVVTVWMKTGNDTETREYQVNRFNKNNKDNIYIDFKACNYSDYNNLLRISLSSKNKPDIFQYGYYELLKNNQIVGLKDAGIDIGKLDKYNFFYFNKQAYGLRLSENSIKFMWNKEILKESGINPETPPSNWNQVLEYCAKIKAAHPDITPFEFPAFEYEDLKASIGQNAVNLGTIYSTFWDYENGKYDFEYSRNILGIYNAMYSKGYISTDFDTKTRDDVRKDFYSKKSAMIITTFEDKCFFNDVIPLDFSTGMSNLPKISENDKQNYYYDDSNSSLVINKKAAGNKAVKEVFEWFMDESNNKQLLISNRALPIRLKDKTVEGNYSEYNNVDNFKTEIYDPTPFMKYNSKQTMQSFYDAIKGKTTIDDAIRKLNSDFDIYTKNTEKDEALKLSNYLGN